MNQSSTDMLKTAQRDWRIAVKLSGQGSYHRRTPNPESLPHYYEAKRVVKEVLQREPDNRKALILMSHISEGLMDFGAAVHYLDKTFDAGEPKTKKALKRLALLRENAKEWQDLLISPAELSELGKHLEMMGVSPSCRSFDFTRTWLLAHVDRDPDEVVASFERRGAFSDFQVLANLVHG